METKDDVALAARSYYDAHLKSLLEPEHRGEFLLIDIDNKDYEIDSNAVTAYFRLMSRYSDGRRFLMRIGCDAAYRSGYWSSKDAA